MVRTIDLLVDLAPGDRFDFDSLDPDERNEFLLEFEGQGFVLSSDGIVGQVEECHECDGEGQLDGGRECRLCQGYSNIVDWGKGWRPFRE